MIRMQWSKDIGTSKYQPDPTPTHTSANKLFHHRKYGSTCGSTVNCRQNIYNSEINSIGLYKKDST